MKKVLIVDDEPLMRISISDALKGEGYAVFETGLGNEGIELIKQNPYDLVITDLRLPDSNGIEVLRACTKYAPEAKVILITAYGSVATAVEAMKMGAYDYITKPFPMEKLLLMIERVLRFKELEEENLQLKEQVESRHNFDGMIYKSELMGEVVESVKIVAVTDSTVLVLGESGTGKELVANAIHYNSYRKDGPFIKISSAALPETLLEAELFGYEKGAFTGAVKGKKGKFELADGGSLFLDEIGELTPAIQVKLLRVLQEQEFDRLGGTETISVNVRIICATQRDLKKDVADGNFREDLYYRLNVVPIMLPPLRDRKDDVLLLADHFLKSFALQNGKSIKGFSTDAREALLKYSYPGNIRELVNAVERAVVLARGSEVELRELPDDIVPSVEVPGESVEPGCGKLSLGVKDFERRCILKALSEAEGNKSLAARLLGISRKTLWEKCKAHEIVTEAKGSQGV